MATIHLVSPHINFGPWDWRSPDDPGIGGSETMHCEMAWRLAARGHYVISYAPLPPYHDAIQLGGRFFHRHVEWRDLSHLDFTQPGLWILIRGIKCLDKFTPTPDQRVWCVFQDVDHWDDWDEAWLPKVDRILALCRTHQQYLCHQHPPFGAKVCLSRNGLRGDLVDATLAAHANVVRDSHRITFASSPDRGLASLLVAFRLIRFLIPDATLHICYGFDNIDKLPRTGQILTMQERLYRLADQPGVLFRGRLGQPALYREWLQTGLMVAPTNFQETGHITLMEAQALGAIPVVNPIWATGENQLAGIAIPGDAEHDMLTIQRYAMAAVHLMRHPEGQEELRGPMMAEARKRYDWSGVVDQYEQWMHNDGCA